MSIKQNEYFTSKEDMADIINSNFKIRKKSISNIARLYDDAMPSRNDEADRYVAEIHFHYMIWKKFGALPEKSLQRIKRITDTILSLSPAFFQLSSDEYEDFIQLTKELHVDFTKRVIYEDKNATGLYMENPDVPLTEQQWAEKQILVKGGKRIAALQNEDLIVTIETKSGEVLDCSFTVPELKEIDDYVFRINADTPELREAVEECRDELRTTYPNMNFSAIFGG